MARMTRRQFGAGAAALTTAAALPLPAIAKPARSAAVAYPAFIPRLGDEAAREARRMARLDRLFAHIDANYFTDDRCYWRWNQYYGDLIDCAQWAYEPDHEPPTEAERAFAAWARKRVPSTDDLMREPWTPIAGLSRTFRRRETVLHEALMRYALAAMAFDYVTYDRLQNPHHPEHEDIVRAYDRNWKRLLRLAHRPWDWPRAETPADLLLMRRVIQIDKDADEVFRTKFLPQALARLKQRGITWSTTDDGRGNRTWMWRYP